MISAPPTQISVGSILGECATYRYALRVLTVKYQPLLVTHNGGRGDNCREATN